MADWLIDLILGLVEGFTEFLPISSTGHLIITRALLDLENEVGFRQMIVIQGAAILAVCFEYRARLWDTAITLTSSAASRRFVLGLFLPFLPAAVAGLAFEDTIRSVLFAPIPVAMALVVGGVLILWAEKRPHVERVKSLDELQPLEERNVGVLRLGENTGVELHPAQLTVEQRVVGVRFRRWSSGSCRHGSQRAYNG